MSVYGFGDAPDSRTAVKEGTKMTEYICPFKNCGRTMTHEYTDALGYNHCDLRGYKCEQEFCTLWVPDRTLDGGECAFTAIAEGFKRRKKSD